VPAQSKRLYHHQVTKIMPICLRVGIKTELNTADDKDDKSQPQGFHLEKGKHAPCRVLACKPWSVVQHHNSTLHLLTRQRVEPSETPTPTKLIALGKSGQKENGAWRVANCSRANLVPKQDPRLKIEHKMLPAQDLFGASCLFV